MRLAWGVRANSCAAEGEEARTISRVDLAAPSLSKTCNAVCRVVSVWLRLWRSFTSSDTTDVASQSDNASGSSAEATNSQNTRRATRLPRNREGLAALMAAQKSAAMPTNLPLLARRMSSMLSFWVICFLVWPSGPRL